MERTHMRLRELQRITGSVCGCKHCMARITAYNKALRNIRKEYRPVEIYEINQLWCWFRNGWNARDNVATSSKILSKRK